MILDVKRTVIMTERQVNGNVTIDEAIEHVREVAEKNRNFDVIPEEAMSCSKFKANCLKCAEEHEQLAEWLEELKAFQENKWTDIYIKRGYNKAIDDFSNALADDLTWLMKFGDEVYSDVGIDVRMRAEQLKEGGENE